MFRTEDDIEREVEKRTDTIDKWLMRGRLTQEQYDRAIAELAKWADNEYLHRRRQA